MDKEKNRLTEEELRELFKNAVPFVVPRPKKKVKKTCSNCADYIVCWGLDEPDNTKAEKCKNWHISYDEYENLFEENNP